MFVSGGRGALLVVVAVVFFKKKGGAPFHLFSLVVCLSKLPPEGEGKKRCSNLTKMSIGFYCGEFFCLWDTWQ